MFYKVFIRPVLFLLSPEIAHHFTTVVFKILISIPGFKQLFFSKLKVRNNALNQTLFGLNFPNPIGLAAGFDKNAELFKSFQHLGFGFIEIGTVTPKGQPGNPKPRMFRLPADKGLINRMGFNNEGLAAAIKNLKTRPKNLIVGGNIGKNKVTPNEKAFEDYQICFEGLFPYVDYFVVNVSSPNTPNLRDLQEKEPLTNLLNKLQELNKQKGSPKPILLKIAPDLTESQLDDIVEIAQTTNLSGLIATNTTIDRSNLKTNSHITQEAGGLSGKPVTQKSTEVIRYLRKKLGEDFPIIGVGGVFTAKDAIEKIEAGANLIQVYTGLIYEGPKMVKNINSGLIDYYKQKHNG
jgi:dihydroorotate dehydrogenase